MILGSTPFSGSRKPVEASAWETYLILPAQNSIKGQQIEANCALLAVLDHPILGPWNAGNSGRPPQICRSKILKSKPNKKQHIRNIVGTPSCSFPFVAHLCTPLHCTMGIGTIAIQFQGSVMRVTTAVLITMASQVMALEGQARPIWEWQLGCSMALFHHQGWSKFSGLQLSHRGKRTTSPWTMILPNGQMKYLLKSN